LKGVATAMDRDDLRIGDAEREQTMAALREHFALGRLTHEELDQRLDQTLSARTGRDLEHVMADLPGKEPATPYAAPPTAHSWQKAMHPHHKHRPGNRRGPGPAAPILFALLIAGLVFGGFGALKVLFFIWVGVMVIMLISRGCGSRR
jgi:hypothetical protein